MSELFEDIMRSLGEIAEGLHMHAMKAAECG